VFVALLLSVEPASASSGTLIITSDTRLTEDHNGPIVIVAKGVTLDCAGHSVTGDDASGSIGITVDADNVAVTHCQVGRFAIGILTSVDATRVLGSTVTGFQDGIKLDGATDGTLHGNRTIGSAFGIALYNASGNVVANNFLADGETGLFSQESSRNQILGNTATGNEAGFDFESSSDNRVIGNSAVKNRRPLARFGFFFDGSRNYVSDNVANDNGGPGFIGGGTSNVFIGNRACHNTFGDAIGVDARNTWIHNEFCNA
jgi:parallel beta-helix repeat protein